jgi:hypothetical protein
LHPAAVFVAEWETVEEVFDDDETRAREVGSLARADTLQELERGCEEINAQCSMLNA